MKRYLAILVAMVFIVSNASAITWTKTWSAADDGSPLSGSDIGNIQNDADTQVPTITGNNTLSGNNTFSGTTTFAGTVSGITGSAAHQVTRGFELVYKTATVVTVNPGTLFHNTTSVNKTTATDLTITDAGDGIDGAAVQTASAWAYVYCDASGNLKLYTTKPNKADTSGNTTGTLIYYYYVPTTTYYRCLGAVYMDHTKQLDTRFVITYHYGEKEVQKIRSQHGEVQTTTVQMVLDDTIPQVTEGYQVMWIPIAPTSSNNKLLVEVSMPISSTGTRVISALFQDATANALVAARDYGPNAEELGNMVYSYMGTAGTTSNTHLEVRVGPSDANTVTLNGVTGGRQFGGVNYSSITVTEITQ